AAAGQRARARKRGAPHEPLLIDLKLASPAIERGEELRPISGWDRLCARPVRLYRLSPELLNLIAEQAEEEPLVRVGREDLERIRAPIDGHRQYLRRAMRGRRTSSPWRRPRATPSPACWR